MEDGRGINAMPMGRLCEGLRVALVCQVDRAASASNCTMRLLQRLSILIFMTSMRTPFPGVRKILDQQRTIRARRNCSTPAAAS